MKINFNIKKLLWTIVVIVLGALTASAIPAHPGAVNVTQSDGSQLTIKQVGDEFYHRTITTDGYTLMQRTNGDYVYAVPAGPGLVPGSVIAHNPQARTGAELQLLSTLKQGLYDQTAAARGRNIHANRDKMMTPNLKVNYQRFRGLVILVNFNNKTFSYGNSTINNMFNQQNFSGYTNKNGQYVSCTGSARDYFSDNSMGQFAPQFDVVGPVTVNYSCTTPQGSNNVANIFVDACDAADALVNFSDYDSDGDGEVDIIYFIVAGYTSNFTGNNSGYLWPHQYWMDVYTSKKYDGVSLGRYSCSGEIYGWESYGSINLDGVGTMVHEFSHALGLMDLYDTNYATNGQANDPDEWDVMAGAPYLNESRTPAGYTIWERYRLGFSDNLVLIDQKRSGYTLQPVNTSNAGYWLATQNDNEYFIIDNRQKTGWDAYIPGHGMTIYRVEYNQQQWWYNTINADASHMYYEMVRAGNGTGSSASDPYPGSNNVRAVNNNTTPNLKTWSGISNDMGLSNITENNGVITFNVVNGDGSTPPPQLSVNPSSLSMNAVVGQTVTKTFTVTGTNLTNAVNVSISGNSAFRVSPTSVSVNDAANGKTITVTYTPTAAGTQTATVTCSSNGASSVTVRVTGTAATPQLSVNPSSLSMNAQVGQSVTKTFTVTGTNLTNNVSVSVSGNNAFSVSPSSVSVSDAANGKTITVTYTPTAAGTQTATVTCSSSGASSVTVNVTGTATPAPTITVDPASLSFSGAAGQTYTKTFTVSGSNLSSYLTLTLNNGNGVYSITPTRITASQAASGATVTVTYAPTAAGTHNASITVSGGGASSKTVNLSGTATPPPALTVNPSSLSFTGSVGNTYTKLFTVTGTNLLGNVSIAVSGGNGAFSITPANITLSHAADGATVAVTYTPTASGTQNATVTCTSNGASSVTVSLTGTASLRGDVNGDGSVDPADISALINYLLNGITPSGNADVNCDGSIDPADISALINYLLLGVWSDGVGSEGNVFTVNGVDFVMVPVEGGTFTMGADGQDSEAGAEEFPAHQVTVSGYSIGQTEVTQALWQAVMGSNPSGFTGDLQRPVEMVSWNTCQEFILRLNEMTGKHFRLPTEAEWEFAARGGNKSKGYKYAGSNNVGDVAWYTSNSGSTTHPVAQKAPNELGLYDMTGNVLEWCQDWYGASYYTSDAQTDPLGPPTGTTRSYRSCSYNGAAKYCTLSHRAGYAPTETNNRTGLRLVLDDEETFTVNGVSFTMVPVKGGTFMMGATEEQASEAEANEYPVHQVTLSSYSIGKTEVTQELWVAVMGSNPSHCNGGTFGTNLQRAVDCVSWEDGQLFIAELNRLTGKNFRMPTEAEWEFAARGGNLSRGYIYAGSNNIDEVAWYGANARYMGEDSPEYGTHSVAVMAPNELGLYDMTGNVLEWCQDWYGAYTSDAQTNPTGAASSIYGRVIRGGSWGITPSDCRVSSRDGALTNFGLLVYGLRLVL